MYKKPSNKIIPKHLAMVKNNQSQSRLNQQPMASKSLSKKELPTFHSRSMIYYEEEDTGHHKSVIERNMGAFQVVLPHKNVVKSPSAKYVRKEISNINLRSTMKNKKPENSHRYSSTKDKDNYELLIKLREVIEDMRNNYNLYKEDLTRLRKINEKLEQQNKYLIYTLKKYEHREKYLTQKMKTFYNDRCLDHEIIIQSLKKVIDGQLQKIIELERQKISAYSCSLRSSKTVDCSDYINHESTPSFPPSSPHPRLKEVLRKISGGSYESRENSPAQANIYEQLDTFRKKVPSTFPEKNQTEEILNEIDNCLDSLSRRKRHL